MVTILKDNQTNIEYSVVVEGKVLFTSSIKMIAENYRNNLTPESKAKAVVVPTSGGKQVLFG
jgi:hypothetical protein